jgi:hypothetical protein
VANRSVILGAIVVVLAVGLYFALPLLRHRPMRHVVTGSLAWAQQQSVPAGKTQTMRLPSYLAEGSADGNVTIAHLSDGRYCVLLKRSIGFKDNFAGRVLCSAPLLPKEVIDAPNAPGRREIQIPGYGAFEELFVKNQNGDREYDVYFDLN